VRYYDADHNRLVYVRRSASPEYWDDQWKKQSFAHPRVRGRLSDYVCYYTCKYLPKGAKVLEAGCGRGQYVLGLASLGYDAHGIDFAAETVRRVREAYPHLPVRCGDVRALPYGDNEFDGYWSLGVIEHFYDGYGPILREARRVLKPDGYAFVTFPHMSRLRRSKARRGEYPRFDGSSGAADFYQFALDEHAVVRSFKEQGFRLVAKRPRDGLKGLRDEVPLFEWPLRVLCDARALPARFARAGIGLVAAPWTSHTILLVLRKLPNGSDGTSTSPGTVQ
jgi:SAM-dependent methyltransferase